MYPKTLTFFCLLGLVIYLGSCSKEGGVPNVDDPNPNPNDTITKDTVPNDTTTIDTTNNDTTSIDTNTNHSKLSIPSVYIFQNTALVETEYYEITGSGRKKVNEPYYMRYTKNLLQSSIKDDHSMPYKEIHLVTKDKMTIYYKDGRIVENNAYTLQNEQHVYLGSTGGYLGSFTSDYSGFDINLSPYSYSNESNRPMYPRLYLCISNSPDKNKTLDYLQTSQSLLTGDTLAVNFSKMVYLKK